VLRKVPVDERPERPFTGFKLARAVVSADGERTGFAGLTLGADQIYEAVAVAACVWNSRHAPPRKWCGCGFYCLHELSDARALGCATENRSALLLEITAAGRYIRYERGLRYSRQRVRVIRESRCECGRPGSGLADAGTGLVGWRHLTPVCERCAMHRPALLTLAEFAARLGGGVTVSVDAPLVSAARTPPGPGPLEPGLLGPGSPEPGLLDPGSLDPDSGAGSGAGEPPLAVITAEIALLHARLDELQARLDG
jgi:hypothetical protein